MLSFYCLATQSKKRAVDYLTEQRAWFTDFLHFSVLAGMGGCKAELGCKLLVMTKGIREQCCACSGVMTEPLLAKQASAARYFLCLKYT